MDAFRRSEIGSDAEELADDLNLTLRYTKLGPSAFLLDNDQTKLPNCFVPSRLRKTPGNLQDY